MRVCGIVGLASFTGFIGWICGQPPSEHMRVWNHAWFGYVSNGLFFGCALVLFVRAALGEFDKAAAAQAEQGER